MLKKILHRLLHHRHFWRDVGFDELSEIYVSMMFRGLALSVTGLFVPLYMIQLGYNMTSVAFLAACYFLARAFGGDVAAAYAVARIGPKHTILIGNILLILSTLMFLTLEMMSWPIILLGIIWGASASFFFVAFHVDFSKIKHKDHGGKEIGYLNIMERLGFAIGPVVGGLIAMWFGGQYIFLAATVLLFIGVIPLFQTGEPTKTHQKLDWKGLDVGKLKRDFFSFGALGVEHTLSMFLWPLYLGLFVLAGSTAYAKLGALSSISVIVSMTTAYIIGRLIDKRKGRDLLRISVIINALIHIIRPFIRSYGLATATSIASESVQVGYRMPFTKGMYDASDDLPGYRIVYITSMEIFSSAVRGVVWLLLAILTFGFSNIVVITIGFVIASIATLLVATERFKALN